MLKIINKFFKKRKKGFTLVELLAALVIMAILATILIPGIQKIIKEARKEAFRSSAYGIINSTNEYITSDTYKSSDDIVFTCNGTVCSSNSDDLSLNGWIPISGTVTINKEGRLI